MKNKISIRALTIFLFASVIATVLFIGNSGADEKSDSKEATTNLQFQEGQHYHRISPNVATDVQEGSVEVRELFWYGCPHCYKFEKHLDEHNSSVSCEECPIDTAISKITGLFKRKSSHNLE